MVFNSGKIISRGRGGGIFLGPKGGIGGDGGFHLCSHMGVGGARRIKCNKLIN